MKARLTTESLPVDHARAVLIGRVWLPKAEGPAVVRVLPDGVYDLSPVAATSSQLLDLEHPAEAVRHAGSLERLGSVESILANSAFDARDHSAPWFLAPCDLQAIKACGVTFVASMLERVIEEQARGDAAKADGLRASVAAVIGSDLARIKPGSADAQRVKDVLIAKGLWSQYLEVGIGPDAEVFTKSQPMSAVGTGAEIGILAKSEWSNPEPEVVLAINSRGNVAGASLGNDVNLRDFEGRSALLLGKAKDNNASCAIGPFIRLLDGEFSIDDVRRCDLELQIEGPEGFSLRGSSSMSMISRDPLDLVVHATGANHQYPDGAMLFLGTMFAPTDDRLEHGKGFTHVVGDFVTVASPKLGALINRVNHCDKIPAWTFGAVALMKNLAARRLI
jgi:fumarylacetoacetate (FAA) hydrolase family protein